MVWASLYSLLKKKQKKKKHNYPLQELGSFTSHHLAYKVIYLSAESFMTRDAVKVSLADCLDVVANENILIS